MAPEYKLNMREKDFNKLIKTADALELEYTILSKKNVNIIPSKKSIKSKYLEVLSIGLAVPKRKTLFNYTHEESLNELHSNNTKMLNIYEFTQFLKEAKEKDIHLYNEITQARLPWRAERLDAKFKLERNGLCIHSYKFTDRGEIIPDYNILDLNTLLNDKIPGISIDSWIEDSTLQGLPKNFILEGNLHYGAPRNGSIAKFITCKNWTLLSCDWEDQSYSNSDLGVRAARQLK